MAGRPHQADQSQQNGPRLDTKKIWEGIPGGQRDAELTAFVGKMRRLDVPDEEALELLRKAAARCKPPISAAVAEEKVESPLPEISTPGESADDLGPDTRSPIKFRVVGEPKFR